MRKEDKGVIIGELGDSVKEQGDFQLVDRSGMDGGGRSEVGKKCLKGGMKVIVVKNCLVEKGLMRLDVDQ